MNKYVKIFHSTLELDEIETRYYMVFTEVCLLTNRVLRTYSIRLGNWVSENPDPNYEYYQPIYN